MIIRNTPINQRYSNFSIFAKSLDGESLTECVRNLFYLTFIRFDKGVSIRGYTKENMYPRYHHNYIRLSENFSKICAIALVKYCDNIAHDGLYLAVPSTPHMKYMR